jgi:hypothetical protein
MCLHNEEIGSKNVPKYAENGPPKGACQSERLELIQEQTKEAVIIQQRFRAKIHARLSRGMFECI